MRQIKKNRGITLIMLVMYIILAVFVLAMLATLTANFRKNLNNINARYSI